MGRELAVALARHRARELAAGDELVLEALREAARALELDDLVVELARVLEVDDEEALVGRVEVRDEVRARRLGSKRVRNSQLQRVAPKPEEVIDWEAELRPISLDGWLGRRRLLHCDSYRMRWGGGGHSYGRRRMLEAFEASGFACDPTPVNHTAYVDGLRESQFVACPRGNGIQVYRVWEALLLGAVPIVLRTHFPTHDALYAKLPVVMIGPSTARPKFDAWTTVTPDFLRRERARIDRLARENAFDLAGAFLPYWLGRLFNESLP